MGDYQSGINCKALQCHELPEETEVCAHNFYIASSFTNQQSLGGKIVMTH